MFDGHAGPWFVTGCQQVEEGSPQDRKRKRASGNANFAATFSRWLTLGKYGKPIVDG
jgi:hypothetical protein